MYTRIFSDHFIAAIILKSFEGANYVQLFLKYSVMIAAFLLSNTFSVQGYAQISPNGTIYAQLESTGDQLATADNVNQGIPIQMQTIDGIAGMEWDSANNKLQVKEDGVYFIMAVAQVGARESAADIVKGGDIYFWFELNGKPFPNSGSWVFASPKSRSKTLTEQMVMSLKQNDTLRFMFSASGPSMGLLSAPAEKNQPSAGGMSLTLFKIEGSSAPLQPIQNTSAGY